MRTINEIVTWFYDDEDFRKLISFYLNNEGYFIDEAIPFISVIILEYKKPDLLLKMREKELRYFINQIIRKQLYSDQSPFFKQYKKFKYVEYIQEKDLSTYNNVEDDNINIKLRNINNKEFVKEIKKYLEKKKLKSRKDYIDSSLYLLYKFSNKTYREIAKELSIPTITIFDSIKRVDKELTKCFKSQYKKINEQT